METKYNLFIIPKRKSRHPYYNLKFRDLEELSKNLLLQIIVAPKNPPF